MKLNLQLFATKSIEQLAKEVIQGKYGNGQARKNALGSNYAAVQSMVNSMLNGSSSKTATAPKATTTPTAPKATTAPAPSPTFNYVDPTHVTEAWNKANSLQKPVEQESAWLTQLNDTLNKVLNKEKFTYDLNGDALYQQYKDQAVNQGKMAMFDTIGQASAMTGGYGNSYAQSVGQQAYQGYLQQLNDKVPELYQLALSQYNQEQQDLKDQASILHNLVQQDHDKYRESLSDYHTDRDYYTGVADSLSKTAYERAFDKYQTDYTLHRDAIEDANTAKQYAYDTAMGMLNLGVTPSAEMLKAAGISSADASAIAKKVIENESYSRAAANDDDNGGTLLWTATGTYDDNGNPIFRSSDGKTQSFGSGINPYTGTTHKDAKGADGKVDSSKVFSNGYQPNNINGVKLKDSGISTNITGKNQTIWQANGKYWLWRGDLNKYVEVDISDLD